MPCTPPLSPSGSRSSTSTWSYTVTFTSATQWCLRTLSNSLRLTKAGPGPTSDGRRMSMTRCRDSARRSSSSSTTASSTPVGSCPASRVGRPHPAATLAATSGAGPLPTTSKGVSMRIIGAGRRRPGAPLRPIDRSDARPSASEAPTTSKDRQRVDGTARHALEADGGQRELELPPVEAGAGVGQLLELAVVDEPHAHGDDPDHVDRHVDLPIAGRRRVLRHVRGQHGHAPLVEERQAGGLVSGPRLV